MMDRIQVMQPWFGDAEVEAIAAVIRSGWVAQGPKVAEFETAFAQYSETSDAVAVSSCTAGLHLVLHALGFGPGDEIIVPSLSFIATANAVRYVGATPVFADVDVVTQNLTVETIDQVVTPRTKAVMAVHQVGMPLDLDSLRPYCSDRDLQFVEDAACAVGSTYRGQPIGASPALAVFSFHPRKLLTTGEGGMIVASDADLVARLKRLRAHSMSMSADERHDAGRVQFEEYVELGFNFRMTDLQAAVGLVQLGRLPAMIERRRLLGGAYRKALDGLAGIVAPIDPPYGTTNYQSYAVRLTQEYPISRDLLMQRLLDKGISTRRGVMATHREPAFQGFDHRPLPNTELLADQVIILPLHHQMTDGDIDRVAESIRLEARV
jgi:dTDP-4-amino-4,6-dideoxygalactose transaminase